MTCPSCGRSNDAGAVACAACGAALAPERVAGEGETPTRAPRSVDVSELPTVAGGSEGTAAQTLGSEGPLKIGSRLGDRYEIERLLGVGGMGAVYKAHDRELDRPVALKVIRPDMAARPGVMERFKREILLASRISHRNVLRIHDLGEFGPIKFISMHYVEGTSLREVIDREAPLPLDKALPLFREMADALRAAHEAGVVHRDLKPSNILLDTDGHAYIADFGISRSLDHGGTMTETGAILGTVSYMSPEQARGEVPDHRSDIYSLGLIFFEMLTGSLPFQSENALSVLMKRVHEDVPTVRLSRKDLPPWIAGILARALRRDLAERYPNVEQLQRDLERGRATLVIGRRLRRAAVYSAVAIVLAGAAIAAALRWWPARRPPTLEAPRASVILLPFLNGTGEARFDWIRTGLPDLLRSDLQQTPSLRVIGGERVKETLESFKLDRGDEFSDAAIQQISRLIGADRVVTGKLLKAGTLFRVDARVLQVGVNSVTRDAPLRVEGEGESALFSMVDDLGSRVREGLGISRRWGESRRGARDLSTGSMEALRLYSEGAELARGGSDLEAAKRLEAALNEDPAFAAARALLAETYDRLGRVEDAKREADRAVDGLQKVSPYEAARVRAIRARLSGDMAAAGSAYRELRDAAPNDPDALRSLASFQEDQGELDGALETLRRAADVDPKNPEIRYALGRVRSKMGGSAEALADFQAALAIHTEAGNEEGRARVLNGLGNVCGILGRFDEALRHYQDSLAIRERIGDRRGVGVAQSNIALLLKSAGRYEEAIRTELKAIAVLEAIGDRAEAADAHKNLGDIFAEAGRAQEALDSYQTSLKILREIGDETNLAGTFASIGFIYAVLGRYDEAFFFQQSALEKRRRLGDRGNVLRSLIDIGLVEQVQGRYDEAFKYYDEGLRLAREMADRAGAVVLLANLSNIQTDQGDYAPALASLAEAEATARAIGDRNLIATCLTYAGDVRVHVGDHEGARAALEEALGIAREIGSKALEAEILLNQGELLIARGPDDRALPVLRQAVSAAETSRDQRLVLLSKLRAAAAGRQTREIEAVLGAARSARLRPLATAAELALAESLLASDRSSEALRRAEKVLAEAGTMRQKDVLFVARTVAAESSERLGNRPGALEHASAGLNLLEEMSDGLEGPVRKQFATRPESSAFRSVAEPLFTAAGRGEQASRLRGLSGS